MAQWYLILSAKSNYFTDRMLKIATVEFSPGYGFWTTEEIVGKHHSGAKLQKLRCSQWSVLHFTKSSFACGTLCVFRPLICKLFSCSKNFSGARSREACFGIKAKLMFPACELATLHWQLWIRWLSPVWSVSQKIAKVVAHRVAWLIPSYLANQCLNWPLHFCFPWCNNWPGLLSFWISMVIFGPVLSKVSLGNCVWKLPPPFRHLNKMPTFRNRVLKTPDFIISDVLLRSVICVVPQVT